MEYQPGTTEGLMIMSNTETTIAVGTLVKIGKRLGVVIGVSDYRADAVAEVKARRLVP